MPLLQVCVSVDAAGVATVPASPSDEPIMLVPRNWLHSPAFFVLREYAPLGAPLHMHESPSRGHT